MYTAGVMNLQTTLKAIQKRAELMGQTKGGSMAAILNASEEQLKAGLEEGSKVGYVDVANYNSPAQVVITGDSDAVKAAGDYMLANGVRRVVPLAVSGAFHSKFMEGAGKEFAGFVSNLELNDAKLPVTGLNKKIAPETTVYNIFDKASLEATVAALKEQMAGV